MIDSGERLELAGVGPADRGQALHRRRGRQGLPDPGPAGGRCGAAVPQLSGRGLGHTGGTLDKLEAIPGWRAPLSPAEMLAVLRDVGCVICAAGRAWPRPTAGCTRCATSPARSSRSR